MIEIKLMGIEARFLNIPFPSFIFLFNFPDFPIFQSPVPNFLLAYKEISQLKE